MRPHPYGSTNLPAGKTGVSRQNAFWHHPWQFRVLCPDGKVRVTTWIGQEADTWFSWPAVVRIKGKRLRGYVTTEEDASGEHITTFVPYTNQER